MTHCSSDSGASRSSRRPTSAACSTRRRHARDAAPDQGAHRSAEQDKLIYRRLRDEAQPIMSAGLLALYNLATEGLLLEARSRLTEIPRELDVAPVRQRHYSDSP
jgi:hypothetical protein